MRIIAFNGIFILIPSAYFLNQWAIKGNLDTKFYKLQALELIAGLSNLVLMAMNIVDGIKITPKRKVTA